MSALINIFIVLFAIISMECLSWFIHKYLFHGPLWFMHKSHHQKTKSFFEWNDLFAALFAAVSLFLMYADRDNLSYRFRDYFIWPDLFCGTRLVCAPEI
ncbi:hypothetical protein [Pedobacter borealis]|uniref:hypothetical protein n=1 Tax=Pedobacter borealis TaxID=475254 RepID=UPI001FD8707F|nr:hypothetical protein [Pedobacter borealis]